MLHLALVKQTPDRLHWIVFATLYWVFFALYQSAHGCNSVPVMARGQL